VKDFLKNNFVIIFAFSLPVVLIAVVALSAYLPSVFLSTNYNFVYAACTDGSSYNSYRCDDYLQQRYSVVDGSLVVNEVVLQKDGARDTNEEYCARLFFHNTETNETREITVEQAQELMFSELLTSPDGVTVSSEYDRGADIFLLFDSGSSYGHYLVKGNMKRKLNLINSDDRYYYRNNFKFIGWALPGRN